MATVVDCLLSLKQYYDLKHEWKQGTELGMQSETKSTATGFFPGKPLNNILKSGSQPRKRWLQPDPNNGLASDNQLLDESLGLNDLKIEKLPQKPVYCRGNVGSDRTFDVERLLSSSVMSGINPVWDNIP